jgi:hypothetical protein
MKSSGASPSSGRPARTQDKVKGAPIRSEVIRPAWMVAREQLPPQEAARLCSGHVVKKATDGFSARNDSVAAPLLPLINYVDEAKSMTEKQLKTADELKRIIMQEIRKNPNCSAVQAVEIVPAPEQSATNPNWRVSIWTLEGEPSAPQCADDIERDIQSKFALA